MSAPSEADPTQPGTTEDEPPAPPVRSRRDTSGRRTAVRDPFRAAPQGRLKTLPADGVLLEDLIATMQSEYGTPSTPQEYRLLIKVPTTDEAAPPASDMAEEAAEPHPDAAVRAGSRPRRRRRSRRRTGAGPEDGDEAEEAED